ncbi:hypothetical protein [Rhodococcus sp. (in: high G+C Gram-positive bacteria)]|uniref:hypothetical protein n=1 Tax=Rhodococcus sp. TaxID=1831 RepID=UPI001A2A2099|nr:hypothetical protein [Rhodococcus sp. (in: high G+C Gram-positive bacteria)]MBJ7479191.1 hypothetical protein [Rhodococcus sp. (in: high G+C Gram-positive bacteria)]
MTGDRQHDTTQNRTAQRSAGPRWDPRIAVLSRPDGRLQLGWTPGRAVLLTLPAGVDARAVKSILRTMDGSKSRAAILWEASRRGIPTSVTEQFLAQLADSGFVHTARRNTATVRIHGVGPLSDAVERALVTSGVSTRRSRGYRNTDVVRSWNEQLVVLADDVVTDPRLVSDLVRCGLPHLSVRIRDGNGVVGPLVLPGRSSCLRCADIIRSELDPHWLHLSAQLLGSAGHAESAMIHASVALALAEIDATLGALDLPGVEDLPSAATAASLSSTLEIALRPYRITTRRWPRQISCSCQYLAPVSGKGRPSQT